MSKYSEIVALLEWADKKTQKPLKQRNPFKESKNKDIDIVALIKKKKEEAELLEKFLKETKKDDKKPPNNVRVLTGLEWFVIGLMMYPIVGPAYKVLTHNLEVFSAGVK